MSLTANCKYKPRTRTTVLRVTTTCTCRDMYPCTCEIDVQLIAVYTTYTTQIHTVEQLNSSPATCLSYPDASTSIPRAGTHPPPSRRLTNLHHNHRAFLSAAMAIPYGCQDQLPLDPPSTLHPKQSGETQHAQPAMCLPQQPRTAPSPSRRASRPTYTAHHFQGESFLPSSPRLNHNNEKKKIKKLDELSKLETNGPRDVCLDVRRLHRIPTCRIIYCTQRQTC